MSANSRVWNPDKMMEELIHIGRKPVALKKGNAAQLEQLPQVHALNSLRHVFRTSNVRQRAEKYVVDCLQLATDCLGSKV
jgi:hypothetical protein